MRRKYFLLVVIGLCLVPKAVMAAGEFCPESAQKFWSKFRQGVVKGDAAKVANSTRFPFEIRGSLDSSDAKQVDRKEFISRFTSLTDTDPGLSAEPSTMRSLVKSTLKLKGPNCNPESNQFRVGSWVFEKTTEGWLFVRAFIED